MSRALETLARLQRAQIDEAKGWLSAIVTAREDLARQQEDLAAQIAAEQVTARAGDNRALAAYGDYAPRAAREKRALAEQDERLAGEEATWRERVSEAYIELKKIEHLVATQADRERIAMNARELAALDEAAVLRAGRS